jgi:hypothetical protein
MKNKNSVSSKNNGFVGQFMSLDNNEMSSLRGGKNPVTPPPPPAPGEDFPIILNKVVVTTDTAAITIISLPVL